MRAGPLLYFGTYKQSDDGKVLQGRVRRDRGHE